MRAGSEAVLRVRRALDGAGRRSPPRRCGAPSKATAGWKAAGPDGAGRDLADFQGRRAPDRRSAAQTSAARARAAWPRATSAARSAGSACCRSDFVNVLVPAHYQVPFSRLGPYDRSLLDRVVYGGGEFTEQWAHEASIVPVETWPLLRYRMGSTRPAPRHGAVLPEERGVRRQRDRAHPRRGPLGADDLPRSRGAARRIRVVDRHHPEDGAGGALRPRPARRDGAPVQLPRGRTTSPSGGSRPSTTSAGPPTGSRCASCCSWPRARQPARPGRRPRRLLPDAGARGSGARWQAVGGGSCARWPSGGLEGAGVSPRACRAAAPGQSVGPALPARPGRWYRARTARLFGFDYRLEIFLPREKRRWGYYGGFRSFSATGSWRRRPQVRPRAPAPVRARGPSRRHRVKPGPVAEALALSCGARWPAGSGSEAVAVERRGRLSRVLAAASRG